MKTLCFLKKNKEIKRWRKKGVPVFEDCMYHVSNLALLERDASMYTNKTSTVIKLRNFWKTLIWIQV